MKKLLFLTLTAAAVASIGLAPISANAAQSRSTKKSQVKIIVVKPDGSFQWNGNFQWNCPDISIPGLPSWPGQNKPEQDKPSLPDVETPEQNKPEQDKPEQNKPEQGKPEQDKPEQDESQNTEASFIRQVVTLVNKERKKAGLSPVTVNKKIEAAAAVRAKEIKSSFSHTRPDGSSFSTALREQGVSYRGSGENIAWGQKTADEVMKGWMNSPGHRANILNKSFTSIGVGCYEDSRGVKYWTQLFTY